MERYSVDADLGNNALCGWFGSAKDDAFVDLYHHGRFIARSPCTLSREDVRRAGLHDTGMCGFAFYGAKGDVKPGNIYKIVYHSAGEVKSFYRLFGDSAALATEFVNFELLPRNDMAFLEATTEQVVNRVSDVLAFKTLMIRLRRGKRANGWRGEFLGVDYKYKDSDFLTFKYMFESNLSFWLDFMDARYLWSTIDTYADYGPLESRFAALAVSNYMYAERFLQTQKCIFDFVEKREENKIYRPQLRYWGGMKTNQLAEDDAIDIFITRNVELYKHAPVIGAVFFELIKRSAKESDSPLGFNAAHSKYINDGIDYFVRSVFPRNAGVA